MKLAIRPLTPDRLPALEDLFGKQGPVSRCWCMYWRLRRSEFEQLSGDGNREMLKAIVDSGEVPGILAYTGEQPIGWCSVAPRADFSTLDRSRILKPVDDEPVWSITCHSFSSRKACRCWRSYSYCHSSSG